MTNRTGKNWITLGVLTAALWTSAPAGANVSLKNGNFFIGYTDIVYPGGFDPKIERVYNSKTPYRGIFGWGWGIEYEVYVTVAADGSVLVHEYGGGAENRFVPNAFNQKQLEQAADNIVAIAKTQHIVNSPKDAKDYRDHLLKDADYRNTEWEKFVHSKLIQPRTLPVNTQLHSNRFSYQYITKVDKGYIRSFDNGRQEYFEEADGRIGRLRKVTDKNKNFIELSYNSEGKLQKIVDNFGRKMFFTFNNSGLLEKIEGENGKTATYHYNDLGELTESKDVDGNSYAFKYDSGKRHNLKDVLYSDHTSMHVEYYSLKEHENVQSVKDRDGTVTEYKYVTDSRDRGHYTVAVAVKGADGKAISASQYEYFNKYKSDGEEWTYRLVTTLDGDRTETTYNECCGLPLLIKHGGQETAFEYDVKGHVIKKTTPSEVTRLTYDQKASKVKRVERFSKRNPKAVVWSEFHYDDHGNLDFAKNSENKGVRLVYDTNGRIHSMIDQSHRRIDFKYDVNSKPVEITDPAVGTINVSYTNSGEIAKVESTAGRKIALQVTSAFQNLLDIIRPAGVSLSF